MRLKGGSSDSGIKFIDMSLVHIILNLNGSFVQAGCMIDFLGRDVTKQRHGSACGSERPASLD